MILGATIHMWFTFAVIGTAIVAYMMERTPLEVISAAIVAVLMVFFYTVPLEGPEGRVLLSPEALLSGFASQALITIMALLVIGQGLYQTGALEGPTRQFAAIGAIRPRVTFVLILLIAAAVSAFMNNTPVVVIFIPVITALASRLSFNPSKVLIPLSFLTILGGMTTVIGSSTNLLVAGSVERMGMPAIGFFDFFVPGIVLALVGSIYVIFVAPYLLAPRETMAAAIAGASGKQFIAQIEITPDHPLNGEAAVAGLFPSLKDMTVRLVQRGEHAYLPPFEDVTLRPGDVVIVAATRGALTDALKARNSILASDRVAAQAERGNDPESAVPEGGGAEIVLVEAVVAPGSRLIGRVVEQAGFRAQTGCIVLGIQRRSRMIRSRMDEIRMEAGDVLLIMGPRERVRPLRLNRDLLLLEWSLTELPDLGLASRGIVVFAATIGAAATGLVPIVIAALAGAIAMVVLGCLNIRQASRAFDRQIYMLIGASIAMAMALEATGGAQYLATNVVSGFSAAGVPVILSAFFLLIAVLTNFLSNNAAALLFTPIAVNTANALGADPYVFVYTVIFAANCSFATPMGYQTNLLVMGPGHYQFSDFARAGAPLTLLMWITFTLFAPWYYGLM